MTNDLIVSLLIFIFISLVNAIYAVRLIMVTRGRRIVATSIGFFESIIFITSFGRVVNDLSQWHALLAYCFGTAVGSVVGMMIESRFIESYVKISIATLRDGTVLAGKLRAKGYGATLTHGIGKDGGEVILIQCITVQQNTEDVIATARATNPRAFITVEEAQSVYRGWLRRATSTQE